MFRARRCPNVYVTCFSVLFCCESTSCKVITIVVEESHQLPTLAFIFYNMATLDDSFPKADVAEPQDERAIVRLMRFLETRIRRRGILQEETRVKQDHFRNILVEIEYENASLRFDNNKQKKIISTLEDRICKLQNHIDGLLCKLNNSCDAIRDIQQELRYRDKQFQQQTLEKQKIIQRCNIMIQAETDRMTKEMETKLQEQHERLMSCIKKKDDKLRLARQILTSTHENTFDSVVLTSPMASSSKVETREKVTLISKEESSPMTSDNLRASKSPREQIYQTSSSCARTIANDAHGKAAEGPSPSLSKEKPATVPEAMEEPILMTVAESSMPSDSKTKIVEELNSVTPIDSSSSSTIVSTDTKIVTKINFNTKDKIPVVNPRYQQVKNADRWIDHRPAGIVPTGTILQPQTQPRKRTIRKLTNPKDFVARTSRYCLFSQEQDADGELETKLYKANVLPTCGGGAQIVFNDIECLKQISPTAAKRNGQIKLENLVNT